MDDLCDKLIERLRNESEKLRTKIFKKYTDLLKKLQKKPVAMNMTGLEWEMFKFHLSYQLLSAAVAEMEKSLNYRSWGLKPPNAPPGPIEEYEGDFDDSHSEDKPWISEKEDEEDDDDDGDLSEGSTEIDEAKLAKLEKEIRKEFGEHRLSKTKRIDTNLAFGIRFTKDIGALDEEQEDEQIGEEGEEEVEEEHLQAEEDKEEAMRVYYSDDLEEEEILEEAVQEEEPTLNDLLYGQGPTKEELDDDDFFEEDPVGIDNPFIEEEEEIEDENKVLEKLKSLTEAIKNYPPMDRLKTQAVKDFVPGGPQTNLKPTARHPSKQGKLSQAKINKSIIENSDTKKQESAPEKKKHRKYMGGDPALYIKLEQEPPPWVRKRFLAFAEIQWRQILSDAIDDIVALVESINIFKGSQPITNIQSSERMQTSC